MAVGDRHSSYDATIAVPTRNAGPDFPRLLDAVFSQDTSLRVEVLAIDSGSTDGTLELLQARPIRIVEIPKEGFDWGTTRERAYEQANGDVVINLSQDAIPAHAQWIENLIRPLKDPNVGVSCGSSIPDPQKKSPQFPWERNGYFYFTREIRKFVARYGKGVSFGNSAVPRRVWQQLHFEPQPTGEDFQFQMKLHRAGLRAAFPDDAPVLHHHNYALRALFRRCRNEGFALRAMGCPYTELDLACDLASLPKFVQWLREVRYGRLHTLADFLFPVVRPVAVYLGSRFSRRYTWY